MKLRIKVFCHSIVSDWNHGNAHFLRGVVSELIARGHDVETLEPLDSWSRLNLIGQFGNSAVSAFEQRFPLIRWSVYDAATADLDSLVPDIIGDADLAIVHEWNPPQLIEAIGRYRHSNASLRILFHDTHHRAITAPGELHLDALRDYDGMLVYGQALQETYARSGWTTNVTLWHEAADTRVFNPMPAIEKTGDLAWIGNWGDDERTQELEEFLIGPAARLRLRSEAYGVRYPEKALARLVEAGFMFGGWLPNYRAPEIFARHRVTVHVPRKPYITALPGIPTIRPFEAMACGIPLICARWRDTEGLFREGSDYLVAETGEQCERYLREILEDEDLSAELSANGLETIRRGHTCSHRVDELLAVYEGLRAPDAGQQREVEVCS